MSYHVLLGPNARRDRDLALAWYDAEAPEQSERFIVEFYAAARRLEDFPRSAPVVRRGVRQVNLKVFPYRLLYRVHEDAEIVQIIAGLHERQDPARLDDRL
ncbi:type II toxin-antitoxin system RelE/ParE family toxin [Gryllotalpicola sp.]|uniref:type II toxin-antitoxin system RelE/ParE family toxin n=1 Tax=Gryllotalpicola sp. TaxID=1932787 RepID=UPI0026119829|nr:type II toxin-antitoxin system RelE/ParE family toxin [Gryllotalpicola sp.]